MEDNRFTDEKIYCNENDLDNTVFRDWTNLEQLLGYKVPYHIFDAIQQNVEKPQKPFVELNRKEKNALRNRVFAYLKKNNMLIF